MIGFLLAFITSLFFSIYVLPKKLVKEKTMYYTTFLTLGFLLTSFIAYILYNITGICTETVSISITVILILRGLFWFLSVYIYSLAIDKIGISRAVQYQNLKTPLGVILTMFLLHEFLITNILSIIISTLLIFLSALMLTLPQKTSKKINLTGILYAIMSAILLAITNLLQKWITNQGIIYSQQIITAFSSFFFSVIYIIIKDNNLNSLYSISKRSMRLAILGGCIFYFATFSQALAYKHLPASIVSIIVQFSTMWSVIIGIIFFKEISFKNHWIRISGGIITTLLSIIILLK